MHISMQTYMHIRIYAYMDKRIFFGNRNVDIPTFSADICVYEYMHIRIYAYTHICVYEYMHICVYEKSTENQKTLLHSVFQESIMLLH